MLNLWIMMPFWSWFRKFPQHWRHILRWRNHWNFSAWKRMTFTKWAWKPRGVQQPRVILYSSFHCQGELDQEEARIRLMEQPWGRLRLLCYCAVSVPNVLSCFVLQNFFFCFFLFGGFNPPTWGMHLLKSYSHIRTPKRYLLITGQEVFISSYFIVLHRLQGGAVSSAAASAAISTALTLVWARAGASLKVKVIDVSCDQHMIY